MKTKLLLALIIAFLLPLGAQAAGKSGKKSSKSKAEKVVAPKDTFQLAPEYVELLKYYGPNEAYKVMRKDSKIWSNSRSTQQERNEVKELIVVQRGDTLLAGENTKEYIDSHRERGVSYIPVVYRGIKGYTDVDNVRPFKLATTDTVYMIQEEPFKKMAAFERSLLPFQFKAMNLPVEPMTWMWIALGGLVSYLVIVLGQLFLPNQFKNTFIFIVIGCAVTSCAEIMYLLSMSNQVLWFFSPKAVGWWLAILNFILTGVVLGAQYWIFKEQWFKIIPDKDPDGDPVPHWVQNVCYVPGILAVITIVMLLIDAFSGNTWGIAVYASVYGLLVLAGLAAMGYMIAIKLPVRGISAFIFYLVASVGLTVCLSILGLWIVLIAIILVVVVILGGTVLGIGAGMVNGAGEKVTGYTSDGRKVTGYKDIYGNVKGNDGKTYTID